jgi:FkbM family methyltransferase
MNPPDLTAYLGQPTEVECELRRFFGHEEALLVFDVGACEGEDTVRYARGFPRARIYTFEPLPANQQLIRENFARHAVTNAELVPLALSDRAGEAVFHVSSGRPKDEFAGKDWNYGNKSSSLLAPAQADPMYGWVEFKERITVPTETLDNFCRARSLDRIDFIHMDVQGAEHLVLQGAARMLPRVTAIWLEVSDRELYAGQKLRRDIEQLMRRHGFRLGFELRREVEGDQFYVNTRRLRTWPYLGGSALRRAGRRLRRLAGRLKRAVIH